MNFNSNSAARYTLQVSNETTEMSLPEDHASSAGNFEVTLTPSLDLNQLSYMRSLELEVKVENLEIDSPPLVFQEGESIQTFVKIPLSLAEHNLFRTKADVENSNKDPLTVKVTDFLTVELEHAVLFLNKLLQNSSNLYLICRYLEIFLDMDSLVKTETFNNLNVDTEVHLTCADLDLLDRYVDIGVFSRLQIVKILNGIVNPDPIKAGKQMKTLFSFSLEPATLFHAKGTLTASDETESLKKSSFLKPISARSRPNPVTGKQEDPIRFIDLKEFYDVNLRSPASSHVQLKTDKFNEIKTKICNYYEMMGAISRGSNGSYIAVDGKKINDIISKNVQLINMGRKAHDVIHAESEKLRNGNNVFAHHFLRLGLHAQSKCRFLIDKSKLVSDVEMMVTFPPIVSYKLGSGKEKTTQRYGNVVVGPISIHTPPQEKILKLSNTIIHQSQKLTSCCRIVPKLLCLATDFLAESSRQQEKEQFFFSHDDMVTFFKVPLKPKSIKTQFLIVESSQLPPQPFYKVHKARTQLQNFKIMLFDENGEFLVFARNSIVKIAMTFRPCLLSND